MLTVMKANEALDYINSRIASRSKEAAISLYLVLIRPHLEHCIQFWVSPYKTDVDQLEQVQWRATKMVGGSICPVKGLQEGSACLIWRRDGCRKKIVFGQSSPEKIIVLQLLK